MLVDEPCCGPHTRSKSSPLSHTNSEGLSSPSMMKVTLNCSSAPTMFGASTLMEVWAKAGMAAITDANTDRANAARPFLIETIALTFLSIDDFRYQFFSFCLDFSASAFSLFTLS